MPADGRCARRSVQALRRTRALPQHRQLPPRPELGCRVVDEEYAVADHPPPPAPGAVAHLRRLHATEGHGAAQACRRLPHHELGRRCPGGDEQCANLPGTAAFRRRDQGQAHRRHAMRHAQRDHADRRRSHARRPALARCDRRDRRRPGRSRGDAIQRRSALEPGAAGRAPAVERSLRPSPARQRLGRTHRIRPGRPRPAPPVQLHRRHAPPPPAQEHPVHGPVDRGQEPPGYSGRRSR
ncbi:hypothetical protein D3C76_1056260 [compost metagenome]